jgi:hypothetical protein
MRRVALDLDRLVAINRDQNATRVWTIVRACGMNNLFHDL